MLATGLGRARAVLRHTHTLVSPAAHTHTHTHTHTHVTRVPHTHDLCRDTATCAGPARGGRRDAAAHTLAERRCGTHTGGETLRACRRSCSVPADGLGSRADGKYTILYVYTHTHTHTHTYLETGAVVLGSGAGHAARDDGLPMGPAFETPASLD